MVLSGKGECGEVGKRGEKRAIETSSLELLRRQKKGRPPMIFGGKEKNLPRTINVRRNTRSKSLILGTYFEKRGGEATFDKEIEP